MGFVLGAQSFELFSRGWGGGLWFWGGRGLGRGDGAMLSLSSGSGQSFFRFRVRGRLVGWSALAVAVAGRLCLVGLPSFLSPDRGPPPRGSGPPCWCALLLSLPPVSG
jgi:hypothetical protein